MGFEAHLDLRYAQQNLGISSVGVVVVAASAGFLVATDAAVVAIVLIVFALVVMVAGCVVRSRARRRFLDRLASLAGESR